MYRPFAARRSLRAGARLRSSTSWGCRDRLPGIPEASFPLRGLPRNHGRRLRTDHRPDTLSAAPLLKETWLALMQDECERSVWSCSRVNVFSHRHAICGRGVSGNLCAKFASFAVWLAATGTRCRSVVTLWRITGSWCGDGDCGTATSLAAAVFRCSPSPPECCVSPPDLKTIVRDSKILSEISIMFDEHICWSWARVSAELAGAIAIARAGFTN